MCLYPKIILNKKYTETKKNKGIIPEVKDERVRYVAAECGHCIECRKKKAREWNIRMQEELKKGGDEHARFICFTFSKEGLESMIPPTEKRIKKLHYKVNRDYRNELAISAFRLFLERWRKKYKKSLKHWGITELGHQGTERIHIHAIIWSNEEKETIKNIWKYGEIWTDERYVGERCVNYIVKYVTKKDPDHPEFDGKILCSPGIGKNYVNCSTWNNFKKNGKTNEIYKYRNGQEAGLPKYYRNKIYSDEEKEKLWLAKLDEGKLWRKNQEFNVRDERDMNRLAAITKYMQDMTVMSYGEPEKIKEWKWDIYMKSRKHIDKMKE